MSYLLHLDMCIACIRQVPKVNSRCRQNLGSLHVSALTVAALEVWLSRPRTPARYLQAYAALMRTVKVLSVDEAIAHQAATVAVQLRAQGSRMKNVDLFMAATALVHGLTLVTHGSPPFGQIQGFSMVDWWAP